MTSSNHELLSAWLDDLGSNEPGAVTHADAEQALADARAELWGDGHPATTRLPDEPA